MTTPQPQPEADDVAQELKVMAACLVMLEDLSVEARRRALTWLQARFFDSVRAKAAVVEREHENLRHTKRDETP